MTEATSGKAITHGTRTGYNRGCRGDDCPSRPRCRDVAARQKKQAEMRRAGVLPIGDNDLIPAAPTVEHLARLLALPNASTYQLAVLAGVSQATIYGLSRRRPHRVRVGIARRILAIGEDRVRATTHHEPAAPIRRLCRSMQAQGFPQAYIARRLGAPAGRLFALADSSDLITRTLADRIRALAAELEPRQGPSRRAAAYARALGFYPLAAYDDDGTLIPEAIRHEPTERRKVRRDTAARRRLYALSATLRGDSTREIATALGCSAREVTRWRHDAGLTVVPLPADPTRAAHIAHATAVLASYDADPIADAYETCLALGLMTGANWRIGPTLTAAAA